MLSQIPNAQRRALLCTGSRAICRVSPASASKTALKALPIPHSAHSPTSWLEESPFLCFYTPLFIPGKYLCSRHSTNLPLALSLSSGPRSYLRLRSVTVRPRGPRQTATHSTLPFYSLKYAVFRRRSIGGEEVGGEKVGGYVRVQSLRAG